MTTAPEAINLYAVPHPAKEVRRFGFPLDHPYLEECWVPAVGPSSVLLLRHCVALWRDSMPARVDSEDLARQLGLGRGTGRHSPLTHTIDRLVRFRFASMASPGELDVFTEVPPLPLRTLERLPSWSRGRHEHLLGQHLDGLARASATASPLNEPPANVRMAQHLDRLANHAGTHGPSLSR